MFCLQLLAGVDVVTIPRGFRYVEARLKFVAGVSLWLIFYHMESG